jgi:uncharacterized membrane protein
MPRSWEGTVRVFLPAWLSMAVVGAVGLALDTEQFWVILSMLLTFAVVGVFALWRYDRYLERKYRAPR